MMGKTQQMKFTPPKPGPMESREDYTMSFKEKLLEFVGGIGKEKRQAIWDEFSTGGITVGDLVKKYDSEILVIVTIIADPLELHLHGTPGEFAQ